jgi:hypothetical protein
MKKLGLFSKIAMYVSVTSGALWLGGYFLRMIVVYQLFQGPELNLRSFISNQNLGGILSMLNSADLTTGLLYVVFISSFLIFLITSGLKLKNNGWLFISAVIIFVTMPFEIYLMSIDYKIFSIVNAGVFDAKHVLGLYINRLNSLGSFSIVEILSYFSVLYFIIFQPLKRHAEEK